MSSQDGYDSGNGTGRHEMPQSWWDHVRSSVRPEEERRVKSDPPYKRTKDYLDWLKWLVMTVLGLVAFGFMGAQWIGGFSTKEEAEEIQEQNETAHGEIQTAVEANEEQIGEVQFITVRIELEQRQTNDRLEILLDRSSAQTRAERAAAEARAREVSRRIERRERLLRDPGRLKRIAENPIRGLEGL
jgi:hypothetical protein